MASKITKTVTTTTITYPCTSPNCNFTFQALSELRFHALITHYQTTTLHICTCRLPNSPIGRCDIGFPSITALRSHLQRVHRISTSREDGHASGQVVGSLTGNFWCGFCRTVIAVGRATFGISEKADAGGRWRVAREEHVRAHFLGWNGVCRGNDLWRELKVGGEGGGEDGESGWEEEEEDERDNEEDEDDEDGDNDDDDKDDDDDEDDEDGDEEDENEDEDEDEDDEDEDEEEEDEDNTEDEEDE